MAREPFESRLCDAVNGAYGARPLASEINIAIDLMQKGSSAAPSKIRHMRDQFAVPIEPRRCACVSH